MAENFLIPSERIVSKIYIIRNKKVMLDKDLAELYGVTTGNLNLAVRRNLKRFPEDFMFQLDKTELKNLILQIATSSPNKNISQTLSAKSQGPPILTVFHAEAILNLCLTRAKLPSCRS